MPNHPLTRLLLSFGTIAVLSATTETHVLAADASGPSLRAVVEKAIQRVKPALVRIQVVSTEYSEGREQKYQSVGSGAIISPEGHLVTNHHVAGHGKRFFCTLSNREEVEAELVGSDPLTDIAVIRLKPTAPRIFPFAVWGDSDRIRVGDEVLAMGSPMALSQSVTRGIISNNEMIMPKLFGPAGRMRLDGEDVGMLVKWFGHDAAIYGGNSGGPLVNLRGEIVGINEISFGLSGAIPGNIAHRVADQLIHSGMVKRSFIGVEVQPLLKRMNGVEGVLVSGVIPGSPAALAGVSPGDLLTQVNGNRVHVRYEEELPAFMALTTSLPTDHAVTIAFSRDGKKQSCTLTPQRREEIYPRPREFSSWGLTARNISALLAKELKRTNAEGAMVTSVRAGGPAGEAKPALTAGDVIVAINGEPVRSLTSLADLTQRLTAQRTDPLPVLATFERKSQTFMAVLKIGTSELKDPGLEVSKAWLPVDVAVISRDIARQMEQPALKGFYVTRVYPGSSAEKAGMKLGDMITAVDGEKLTASAPEHDEDLSALIRQYDIGARIKLNVLRASKPMTLEVELMASPKLRREMRKYLNEAFEFTTRDISFFDKAEEQIPSEERGVWVEEVKNGGWAEVGGLLTDDLITAIDSDPIADLDSLRKKMEEIQHKKPRFLLMQVRRGIHTRFLEFEPDWKQ